MPKQNNAIFHVPPVVKKIHRSFLKKNETLAVAESCTGGLLSYWLTSMPNASQFFLGSVVSYSYLSKIQSFNISTRILKQQGAVNEKVCRLMSQRVRCLWDSEWGLSITGVAGPRREDKDPAIGVAFVGLNGPNVNIVQKIQLKKRDRQNIRYIYALFALDFLYSSIRVGAGLAQTSKKYIREIMEE